MATARGARTGFPKVVVRASGCPVGELDKYYKDLIRGTSPRILLRRFTRLTNVFSKKVDSHYWAIALHYVYYNFCRIHQTLRVAPAMEAGIADHVWTVEEVVDLLNPARITAFAA
jgi:hypothetical protein